jgi:hypothetical protein
MADGDRAAQRLQSSSDDWALKDGGRVGLFKTGSRAYDLIDLIDGKRSIQPLPYRRLQNPWSCSGADLFETGSPIPRGDVSAPDRREGTIEFIASMQNKTRRDP